MEQRELMFNLNQDEMVNQDVMKDNVSTLNDSSSNEIIIKQEITDSNIEITDATHEMLTGVDDVIQDGIPVSLDDFIEFHNEQVKTLKNEVNYVTKCFEVLYKFKNVYDSILDDYFKSDKDFKYKNVLETLETDLITVIAQDEDKYHSLLNEINTEVTLTDENQFEFVEFGSLADEDENESELHNLPIGSNKIVQVVSGVDSGPSTIRKLPGQKTAPPPECPACGYKARCRLKLEAHLLEHKDNPLVVCNYENCELPFVLHNLAKHEKNYHPEISLICEMCNEMFDSKTMLVQHYKLHIKKKEKLKCNFPGCDYTDIYPGRLDRHKKMVHNIEVTKQFKCDYEGCGRIFKDRPSFYTHSLIHKDRNLVYKHRCTFENCGAVFKRRRNLAIHLLKHGTMKRRFSCNISNCKRTYAREKELQRHIEQCHREPHIKTQENDMDDKNDDSMMVSGGDHSLRHVDDTDGESTFAKDDHSGIRSGNDTTNSITIKGEDQLVEYGNKAEVLRIKQDGDDEDNIIFVKSLDQNLTTVNVICEDENASQLGEHMIVDENSTNNGKQLILLLNKGNESEQLEIVSGNLNEILNDSVLGNECELCNIKYSSSDELMAHLKDRHHQYTIKAYRCDYENCTFSTHFRSVLGKHKNTVHGGKYRCEVCGKLSKDSGNHNRHRNIHKNVKFRCRYENCEAVYKSPKAYYVHVLTHSNEQPVYRCDYPNCKYVTYYMNTLSVHKLTHSDVRRFFCPYENCGKGFKRNGDLNKHITHSHKGVKRPQKKRKLNDSQLVYRCTWTNCHFTSTEADTLSKHEEEHATNSVEKYKFED